MDRRQPRLCKQFYCDRRRGSYCCFDCAGKRKWKCKNPCMNRPMVCGLVKKPAAPAKDKND